MEIKDYLSQTLTLNKLIESKKEQIQKIRDEQENVTVVLAPDKVQDCGISDKLGELSAKAIDLENEFAEDVTKLIMLKAEIKHLIYRLDNPRHQLIMTERYLNLKSWEKIASDNNYSWRQVHRIHAKALKGIECHYASMIYCNQ